MSSESNCISRRGLLEQALGAAALAIGSGAATQAQAPPVQAGQPVPPRVRESFDFNWRFLRGWAPGATAIILPRFCGA